LIDEEVLRVFSQAIELRIAVTNIGPLITLASLQFIGVLTSTEN
jgi:hypothetical protein